MLEDRAAKIDGGSRVMPIPPDLAVEIVPRGGHVADVDRAIQLYRSAGFGPVWVVHLPVRVVEVHHPDGSVERLGANDEIIAGPILPGFRRKVSELFGPPAP